MCTTWVNQCRAVAAGSAAASAAVRVEKVADNSWSLTGSACTLLAPAQVTAADVRARAVRLIPSASVGVAPHTATLVNIQTVMWANTPAIRELPAVAILGRRVTIGIKIDHVDWRFGDGVSATTHDAGQSYDGARHPCRTVTCPGYFGHVYTATGAVRVSATVSWVATFRVDGGATQTIPGAIAGPTAQTPLQVKEARGVLVPNPGEH
ncbi:hypothetical protein [uncultured Jatrophihabitans sp.]|uniref:hypothetical protein n=1 Tax=uncultured Jatrophihabitans sp. TaxID=1610747 RepID=UPI0035CC51D2